MYHQPRILKSLEAVQVYSISVSTAVSIAVITVVSIAVNVLPQFRILYLIFNNMRTITQLKYEESSFVVTQWYTLFSAISDIVYTVYGWCPRIP